MATRKPKSPPASAPSVSARRPVAATPVTLTIYRPNGVTTTVQGPDLSVTVAANGALLVVAANGRSYTALAAGQWLTVGTPPA